MILRALQSGRPQLQRLAALLLLVVFIPSADPALASTAQTSAHLVVYAVDAHHHVLKSGARLRAGQRITIYARGFAARVQVQTVDVNRRAVGHVPADRDGVAHLAFQVPVHPNVHRGRFVAIDGRAGGSQAPATPPHTTPSSRRVDRQSIELTVPIIRMFTYRVGSGGHGVEGVGTGQGNGNGGGLANTGFDVLAFLAAGALALVLGAVALGLGRRRSVPR